MMTCDEENQILFLLRSSPGTFFSAAEICRKAGNKKIMAEDPRWALRFLTSLLDKRMVERDAQGHYCLAPEYKAKSD